MQQFFGHKNFIRGRKWENRLFLFFFFHLKSLLEKIEFVLIASITILLSALHHPHPQRFNQFFSNLLICMHLFLSVRISSYSWSSVNIFSFFARISFCQWSSVKISSFWQESFWVLLICDNLFLFMIICENLLSNMIIF